MERKVYEAQIKRFTGEGRGAAVLARIGVRDKDGDVLVSGLLGGEQQAPLIQSHQWQLPPIGRAAVREQGGEMVADFALNLDTAGGREWASVLKFDLERGPLQQWSWAFTVPPGGAESGMHEGQPVRFLRRVVLHEVSPVVVGASIGSRTLALKGDALDQAAVVASVQETLRKGEQLLVKLAVRDFERLRDRIERPHAYVFLSKGERPQIERAAVRFAGWASEELGISPPEVKLFRQASAGESPDFRVAHEMWGGYFPDYMIALDSSLSPEQLASTAAHETAHAAGADEPAAEGFARKFMTSTYREMIGSSHVPVFKRGGCEGSEPDHARYGPSDHLSSPGWDRLVAVAQGLRNLALV